MVSFWVVPKKANKLTLSDLAQLPPKSANESFVFLHPLHVPNSGIYTALVSLVAERLDRALVVRSTTLTDE